jgi:hypothetical protein
MMPRTVRPSRREFLKTSATLSGGVLLGFRVAGVTDGAAQTAPAAAEFAPNAFIRISKANVVTIVLNKAEMGQGVYTSLPMLIAEELEVDVRRVKVVFAPVDAAYGHPTFGMQFTGGSQSIASEWERLRKCSTCHQTANTADGRVPGAPHWQLAPRSMGWENLSDSDLCRALKDPWKNKGRSVQALVEHMTADPLVQWAWSPGERKPPPIGQREFHELVRRWAQTGAACPG